MTTSGTRRSTVRSNPIGGNYNRSTIPFPSTSYLPPHSTRDPSIGLFSDLEYETADRYFASRPILAPTPARDLPALAQAIGVGAILAKDETARFGLNAFKLLGARFAIDQLVQQGRITPGATLVCASEGNHGRAVARAARDAGCRARVYMAHDAAPSRVDAIAAEGADVIRVTGSYDDAVRESVRDAAQFGWTVISDTAWEGYEEVPRLIMLGYTRMIKEVDADLDLVFVQGGVGGLLCGVSSALAHYRRDRRPRIVCVEPLSAACLLASAQAGRPTAVAGALTTTMAGLRNREVSPLAFNAARHLVDAYLGIDDAWSHEAMKHLATPRGGDSAINAGSSGAAALGGLLAVLGDPALAGVRKALALDHRSRVLVIVSEGVTDPELWSRVCER
jgi:diaminopropionate ammonia-lyase